MPNRPQPRFPEPITQPFWEAVKEGKLTYQTCDDCNEVVFYPRRHCPACGSRDLEWRVSRGEGTVYTFSVIRQNRMPGWFDDSPPPSVLSASASRLSKASRPPAT